MTTDYRALCAELLAQALELIDTSPRDDATIIRHQELFDRARDALAQPEAESSITFNESRDSEVMRVDQRGFHYRGELIEDAGLAHRLMVTYLQRHTSMHPEVVEREDAQPAPQEPTDEELYDYWISTSPEFGCADPVGFARAVLARYGRPAPAPAGDRQAAPVPVAVSERLPEPGVKVIAHYLNGLSKSRTVCAIWVPAKSRSDDLDSSDDDFTEYDEETDRFYWPEGWYETIENWDDLGYVKIYEGEVIYWQPLPQWPAQTLPLPSGEVE